MGKAFGQIRDFTSLEVQHFNTQIERYREEFHYPDGWTDETVRTSVELGVEGSGASFLYRTAARVWSRSNYLSDKEQAGEQLTAKEREEDQYFDVLGPALRDAATRLGSEVDAKFVQVIIYATQKMRQLVQATQVTTSAQAAAPSDELTASQRLGVSSYAQPLPYESHITREEMAAFLDSIPNTSALYARVLARRLYLAELVRDSTATPAEQAENRGLVAYESAIESRLLEPPNNYSKKLRQSYMDDIVREYRRLRGQAPLPSRTPSLPRTEQWPYAMEEGEVQGSFLLPGGSTLTAEQVRLKRLQEYADTLTGEAKNRANEFITFYRTLYAPSATSNRWLDVPSSYLYVGSMFCPRPDPLGRFVLCDIMYSPDTLRLRVYLSGTMRKDGNLIANAKGLLLGDGYSESNLYRIGRDKYARSHTPGGVVIKRVGLGTVLYSGHALAAAVYRDAAGCYSDGGSESANAWWQSAIDRGFAEGDEAREPDEREHCESISDRDTGDGGWIVDTEVCATVTVEYSEGGGIRYLPVNNVMASKLVAFGVLSRPLFVESVQFPVTEKHRPYWDTFSIPDPAQSQIKNKELFVRGPGSPYTRVGDKVMMDLEEETAEMLARSFHGQSPVLAASIIAALSNKHPDLAVAYATRPDIAPLLAGNETLKRLLETQRLPGVAGLSDRQHGKVMQAIGLAGLGQAKVSVDEKNPLGLKPVSEKTKRLLAKFKDLD